MKKGTAKNPLYCPHCSAKMVEYKHTITKGLLKSLLILKQSKGKANINEIGLTSNQRNNFQKLRYWNLVTMTADAGTWEITKEGHSFLNGKSTVHVFVYTYRGDIERFAGPKIKISDYDFQSYYQKWCRK
jgi:hypothetical protein